MSFDINTNITSLQAQNYLRINNDFQSKTINEVTSGLRIVSSGDDAAGLAIANSYRSDEAVIGQGVRNANDGLSQLQIADGGISNISTLLDRARTLATQSASGTFTGDRGVLNSEFQSVLGEIDRQAQSIGLNQGGTFAKNLSVFIGGGKASGAISAVDNGSVSLNLSQSTVDTKSLGLDGYQAVGSSTDIGNSAKPINVSTILGATANTSTEAQTGYTTFNFYGQGFSNTSGTGKVSLSVNLSGVTDANTLVTAVNAAIQAAGLGASPEATAFKNANVTASLVTDTNGQHLAFTSSNTAFQAQAGDNVAGALLGNTVSSTSPTGKSVFATTAATGVAAGATAPAAESATLRVKLNGVTSNYTVSLATTDNTAALVLAKVNAGLGSSSGITASLDGSNHLIFAANSGSTDLSIQTSGDISNALGLGTFQASTQGTGTFDYTSITGAAFAAASANQDFQFSINGGPVVDVGTVTSGASETTAIAALNVALTANATTRASGLTALNNGGQIEIQSLNGDNFRLNTVGGVATTFGFAAGVTAGASGASSGLNGAYAVSPSVEANGVSQTGLLSFNPINAIGVTQTVSLSAPDQTAVNHSLSVTLNSTNASTLDQAVATINSQLQQSNDSTLQQIVAVKDYSANGTSEGIRLISSLPAFQTTLGTTAAGNAAAATTVGIADASQSLGSQQGGPVVNSALNGTAATADISNQSTAEAAVTALANAVTALGAAQAVVGRGENQFNYAINLASSQLTNLASAESQIRDADLAAEAANLTKAQILQQAGVAALAQANSAPQAVLSLLKG